eukprot:7622341-Pyramimonas_sp.AAC.1
MVAMWRLRAAGRHFLVKSYSVRNAFATGGHGVLFEARYDRADDERVDELPAQRRSRAVLTIDASNSRASVRPAPGGRVGGSSGPGLFMAAFKGGGGPGWRGPRNSPMATSRQ